uniref:Uncharacterized protein n=1 Tax=Siphoviridae sp. ctLmu1 TaxID=2826253 RepID=A0A8S5NFS0_9CAUD|nr:MAG TPA: hypothetical protein [Siphoviridae sp. ctLmu1]DAY60797.1 MAG TPA: hypothetical protein [Caudoviricetes sp.]
MRVRQKKKPTNVPCRILHSAPVGQLFSIMRFFSYISCGLVHDCRFSLL